MPFYRYQGKNAQGEILQGKVEAATEKEAVDTLESRQLQVMFLVREEEAPRGLTLSWSFLRRVKARDVIFFTRQLSVLISAQVPIVRALELLVKQLPAARLREIVIDLVDKVEGGATLSVALERHRDVFGGFYINIVRSGEKTGRLDEVLEYLADQSEKDHDLMERVRNMMIYPAVILCGLVGVGILVAVKILPQLKELFAELEGNLPWSTRVLLNSSSFFEQYFIYMIATVVIVLVGGFLYYRTPAGRWRFDVLKLKIPIIGAIMTKFYVVRFTRGLHTLLMGGVDVVSSLKIIKDITGNVVYEDLITEMASSVEGGDPIAKVFLESPYVPATVSNMLAVGESSGKLDEVLEKMINFYEREIANSLSGLVSLVEPLVIVGLGLLVWVMVSGIIMPLYNLTSQV